MTQILLWQVFGLRGCYPTAIASHLMAVPEFSLVRFRSPIPLRASSGFTPDSLLSRLLRQRVADYREHIRGCIAGFDISLTRTDCSLLYPPSQNQVIAVICQPDFTSAPPPRLSCCRKLKHKTGQPRTTAYNFRPSSSDGVQHDKRSPFRCPLPATIA